MPQYWQYPLVKDLMISTAEKYDIPYQLEIWNTEERTLVLSIYPVEEFHLECYQYLAAMSIDSETIDASDLENGKIVNCTLKKI